MSSAGRPSLCEPLLTALLCGSVENEAEVRDLFDLVVCLVADFETLRGRTGNAFGQHPEELAAVREEDVGLEARYRRLGATIIDGRLPAAEVAETVLAAAGAGGGTGRTGEPSRRSD